MYILLLCTDCYPASFLCVRSFKTQRDVRSKDSNNNIDKHLCRWQLRDKVTLLNQEGTNESKCISV